MLAQRLRRVSRAILLGLVVTLAAAVPAQAAAVGCRSDPTVLLSNGLVLDLSADIGALPWQVQRVVYTLHVPAGVNAVAIVRTRTWLTSVEQFVIYADNPAGQYDATTVVYTAKKRVPVTANLLVGLALDSASGYDRQRLYTSVKMPGLLPSILPPLIDIGL